MINTKKYATDTSLTLLVTLARKHGYAEGVIGTKAHRL